MRPLTVLVWVDVPDEDTTDDVRHAVQEWLDGRSDRPYPVADFDVQEER